MLRAPGCVCVFFLCSLGSGFPVTSTAPPGNPSLRPASASSGVTGVDDRLISGSCHAGAPQNIKGLSSLGSDAICTPQIRHLCTFVTLLDAICTPQIRHLCTFVTLLSRNLCEREFNPARLDLAFCFRSVYSHLVVVPL